MKESLLADSEGEGTGLQKLNPFIFNSAPSELHEFGIFNPRTPTQMGFPVRVARSRPNHQLGEIMPKVF